MVQDFLFCLGLLHGDGATCFKLPALCNWLMCDDTYENLLPWRALEGGRKQGSSRVQVSRLESFVS